MRKYLLLKSFFIGVSILALVYNCCVTHAQTTCGEDCYPYYFCPFPPGSDHPAIHCSSCPDKYAQTNGLSLYKPGLPNHICIQYNSQQYSGPEIVTGFVTGHSYTVYEAGTNDANITNAISWAVDQYKGICPSDPESNCCLHVILTTSIQPFKDANKNPDSEPSFTHISLHSNDCTVNCDDIPTIYLNFSRDFQTGGNSTNTFLNQGFWVDEDLSNLPSDFSVLDNDYINVYNLSDVLLHEFGHFVGMPDESYLFDFTNSKPIFPCVPDFNTNTSVLIYEIGYYNNHRRGLSDWEKCWFKQLYCPDNDCIDLQNSCSDVDAVKSSSMQTPFFSLLSIVPNPSRHNALITYSLEKSMRVSVDLFDALGKDIRFVPDELKKEGTSSTMVNLDGLANGSYYARIVVGGIPHTFKIIKSN